MFRLWAKIWKENRMVQDLVVCNDEQQRSRTRKIFQAMDEVCEAFDLPHPVWLDATVSEFLKHDQVRFTKDNFIEEISFDYLEIQILEEDDWWQM